MSPALIGDSVIADTLFSYIGSFPEYSSGADTPLLNTASLSLLTLNNLSFRYFGRARIICAVKICEYKPIISLKLREAYNILEREWGGDEFEFLSQVSRQLKSSCSIQSS